MKTSMSRRVPLQQLLDDGLGGREPRRKDTELGVRMLKISVQHSPRIAGRPARRQAAVESPSLARRFAKHLGQRVE